MFERTLTDLVRGIRAHKNNEKRYILGCLAEIREELKAPATKPQAVAKLTLLAMMGFTMDWAAFQVIEVMSSSSYTVKRLGYLAASFAFGSGDSPLLMLTTNLLRKDLKSVNSLESSLALSAFAQIANEQLAVDLGADIVQLTSHTKSSIRKKAIAASQKVAACNPRNAGEVVSRIRHRLGDSDIGVAATAINALCELTSRASLECSKEGSPGKHDTANAMRMYLALVPTLYERLTTSTNNWKLIKLVKLFGMIISHEPRVVKRLIAPILALIRTTSAMSLLHECLRLCIEKILPILAVEDPEKHIDLLKPCKSKLKLLLCDTDPNLRYVALQSLSELTGHVASWHAASNPSWPSEENEFDEEQLYQFLSDVDPSVRQRALELLCATTSDTKALVAKLVWHLSVPSPEFALDKGHFENVIKAIVTLCAKSNYSNVADDFEWYVSTLTDLASSVVGVDCGKAIGDELVNVALRVKGIRPFVVQKMLVLATDEQLLASSTLPVNNMAVMEAVAFILGEYSNLLREASACLRCLLKLYQYLQSASEARRAVLNAIMKLWIETRHRSVESGNVAPEDVFRAISIIAQEEDIECLERIQCLKLILQDGLGEMQQRQAFKDYEMKPIHPDTQLQFQPPEDQLKRWEDPSVVDWFEQELIARHAVAVESAAVRDVVVHLPEVAGQRSKHRKSKTKGKQRHKVVAGKPRHRSSAKLAQESDAINPESPGRGNHASVPPRPKHDVAGFEHIAPAPFSRSPGTRDHRNTGSTILEGSSNGPRWRIGPPYEINCHPNGTIVLSTRLITETPWTSISTTTQYIDVMANRETQECQISLIIPAAIGSAISIDNQKAMLSVATLISTVRPELTPEGFSNLLRENPEEFSCYKKIHIPESGLGIFQIVEERTTGDGERARTLHALVLNSEHVVGMLKGAELEIRCRTDNLIELVIKIIAAMRGAHEHPGL